MTAVQHRPRAPITLRAETTAYERRGAAWEFSTDTSLIQVTVDQLGVALLKINQPETKNVLSQRLIDSLISAFAMVERDPKVKVVVLTSSRTAGPFSDLSDAEEYLKDLSFAVTSMRKPIIAAVAGSALGGGFKLAMMCDIIYAAEEAQIGLPELTLNTILGVGGIQRVILALEKARAMDLIQISSSLLSGTQLHHLGLVARVFHLDKLLPAALALATKIAARNAPVVQFARGGCFECWANDFRCGVGAVHSHLRIGQKG